ncbi:MAG: cupin domain-containing protein [Flavobacteriales bacterium]
MAKTNQTIINPIIGDKVKFLVTAEETKGEYLKAELWCSPGAKGTPLHYHPLQSESFTVIKGKLGLNDNGKEIILNTGDSYTVKPNSFHRFWNPSPDEEVVTCVELRPALKTEYCLETIYAIAQKGGGNKDGLPKNPLQFAALLHEYYGELFVVGPPIFMQKFMAKVVGKFAKILGYKGFIPYQSK